MSENTTTFNPIDALGVQLDEDGNIVCKHCGNKADELLEVRINGGIEAWCVDCVDNANLSECECCEKFVEETFTVYINGTPEDWCQECVDKALADGIIHKCDHCGDYSDSAREVVTRTGGWHRNRVTETWCEDCVVDDAYQCDHCGEWFSSCCVEEYRLWNGNDILLCASCYSDNYGWCAGCDDLVLYDDREEGSDDEWYCPSCIDNHRRSDNLECYNHTCGTFFWLDDGTCKALWDLSDDERRLLFLGIELETDDNDDPNDLADDLADAYSHKSIVMKEDGSLSDDGVEIVSQPMTPKWHLESDMWPNITQIVRNHGGRSHDPGTCGLHIHMSRDFFTDDDAVYRLDRLFNRFRSQLLKFSRRSEYQLRWCRLEEEDVLAAIKDVKTRKDEWKAKKRCAGRYEAINNTNASTVEVRLWRGTLNIVTLKATIQLTAGLALIVNTMEDRLADTLTWSGVKTLVRYALEAEGISHEELDQYLASRNL